MYRNSKIIQEWNDRDSEDQVHHPVPIPHSAPDPALHVNRFPFTVAYHGWKVVGKIKFRGSVENHVDRSFKKSNLIAPISVWGRLQMLSKRQGIDQPADWETEGQSLIDVN